MAPATKSRPKATATTKKKAKTKTKAKAKPRARATTAKPRARATAATAKGKGSGAAARGTTFDFDDLRARLVAASTRALAEVRRRYRADPVCAFALYSDDGAMTVCPAMDLTSARAARIAGDPAHAADTTYAPPEWALESVGAERAFDAICERLSDHLDAHPREFRAFKAALFETCLQALEELRDGGRFRGGPEVLLMFAVSDGDLRPTVEVARLRRLMGSRSPHVAALRALARTW